MGAPDLLLELPEEVVVERDSGIPCKGNSGHRCKGRPLVIGGTPAGVTPAAYHEGKRVGTPLVRISGLDIEVIVYGDSGIPGVRDKGAMDDGIPAGRDRLGSCAHFPEEPGSHLGTPADISCPVRVRAHARDPDEESEIFLVLAADIPDQAIEPGES